MLAEFLAKRRRAIRLNVFRAPDHIKLQFPMDAWCGFVAASPLLFAIKSEANFLILGILTIIGFLGIAYAAFAIAISIRAYGELKDRYYDIAVRKTLSNEYVKSESATAARRRQKNET